MYITHSMIKRFFQANMNNVGTPETEVRHGFMAMFSVPYTFRCSIGDNDFASRWCSSNKDIICLVSKVNLRSRLRRVKLQLIRFPLADREENLTLLHEHYLSAINCAHRLRLCDGIV